MEEIGLGLQQSQIVVLFLSQSALSSFWVTREWGAQLVRMAKDRTAGLLPVLLPGADEDQLHPFLQLEHRLDFRGVDFDDPDILEQSAAQIVRSVRRELPSPGIETVGLPFVVFAMTSSEAVELERGGIFEDDSVAPVERQAFTRLVEELQHHELPDVLSFYGIARDDWRPPIAGNLSARQAIHEVVQQLNDRRRETPELPMLRPQFFSEDFPSDDDRWRRRTWDQLSRLGCIVVIDAVSLFHPSLRVKLERSEFGSSERASMIFVLPVNLHRLTVSMLIEDHIRSHLPRAFERFEAHLDMLFEFGATDIRQFRRWLFSISPEVALKAQGERALLEQRRAMRAEIGEPTGIAQAIFRGPG